MFDTNKLRHHAINNTWNIPEYKALSKQAANKIDVLQDAVKQALEHKEKLPPQVAEILENALK